MTGFIPKEKLTAYQRWELAAFDEVQKEAEEAKTEAEKENAATAGEAAQEQEPIVLPTAADIERMHNEAHEQGYAAGYAEGIATGQEASAQIDGLLNNVQQAVENLNQKIADQLLATAIGIAEQVLRQSLNAKPELLLPVVREAIAALHPNFGHPALFLHPEDAPLIRANLGEQLAHNNWKILEDPALTRGGCRIELAASEVDATVETRWKRVIESIGVNQDWLDSQP